MRVRTTSPALAPDALERARRRPRSAIASARPASTPWTTPCSSIDVQPGDPDVRRRRARRASSRPRSSQGPGGSLPRRCIGLVPEVPALGEDHRDAGLVGGGDDLVVAHRAAGLDDRGDARPRPPAAGPSANGKNASEASAAPLQRRRPGTSRPPGGRSRRGSSGRRRCRASRGRGRGRSRWTSRGARRARRRAGRPTPARSGGAR